MALYKESMINKVEDDLQGRNQNWDELETHLEDYETHKAESASDDVHGLANKVIVESGSNEDGEYIRFGDGTQICWQTFYAGTRTYAGDGTYANPYRSNTVNWTFPKPFISPPTLSLTGQIASSSASARANSCGSSSDITGSRVVNIQCVMLSSNSTDADVFIYALAIGRWK